MARENPLLMKVWMGKAYLTITITVTRQYFPFWRVVCGTLGFQRFKESHHPSALSRSITQPWSFNTAWHCCINCRMEPAASVLWRDILHRADGTILKCQAIEFIESDFNTTISNLKVSWWEQHCLPCERRRFDGSMGQTWPDLVMKQSINVFPTMASK